MGRVSCETQADFLVYSISDSRAGFDETYDPILFEVFQRLHSQQQFPASGFGIAIVKRVILRHGGRVWAQGHVDEGASFFFSLPRQ